MMKRWLITMKAALLCAFFLMAPSCGNNGGVLHFDGVSGPYVNMLAGQIIVTMKFPKLMVDAGAKLPIPKTLNSFAELSPNVEDGGMMFALYLDKNDLAAIDIELGDGNTLPDGRPLPGIQGGVLKDSLRFDTKIGKQDVSFYYHETLFGVWMPFGFETAGVSGYWNVNINGKNVGFLGVVGSSPAQGHKAGGVVLLRLKNLKTREFNKLYEMSLRNPHIKY